MKKISSLTLRQSFTKVLATLQKTGEPILIEKSRKPAAVLISLEDFQRRFVDRDADDRRRQLIEKIKSTAMQSHDRRPSEELLEELREGRKGA